MPSRFLAPLGQAMFAAAQPGGAGAVHYRWMNPLTHKVEPKVTFVQTVGVDVCAVGAYGG
jgi:signal transduction histidine kinase